MVIIMSETDKHPDTETTVSEESVSDTETNAPTDTAEDTAADTETAPKKRSGVIGRILLVIGILILLLLLIGGGIFLAALRQLREDEQIPIVTRDSEYVMETMGESIQYIDDWSQFGGEITDTEPAIPEVTDTAAPETEPTTETEAVTAAPVQIPIYQQNKNNKDVINVLLLGRDARNAAVEYGRTDTMIILSYNKKTKDVKMVSLLRDVYVPIEGHGWNRINTAYAYGGIGLAINTVNDLFSLDIQDYVTIDFNGLISVIDAIGGVDLSLTADEVYMYREEGLLSGDAVAGVHHLNGEFALRHARNRTLGSDFERTRRQRDILSAVYQKVTSSLSLTEISSLITETLKMVKTNMSAANLLTIAADVLASKDSISIDSTHMPFSGTYRGGIIRKMWVIEIDVADNLRMLHEFIYGTK